MSLDNKCPTCEAEPRQKCMSANGKKTDMHQARMFGVRVSKQNQLRPRR